MPTASNAVLVDAVDHLVRGLVTNPDDVRVDLVNGGRRSSTIEVHVHPDDLGKVIGRKGRTVNALRSVISGVGSRWVRIEIIEPDGEYGE